MSSELDTAQFVPAVQKARDALARCDAVFLEQLAQRCEWLVNGGEAIFEVKDGSSRGEGLRELKSLGLLLEDTKRTLQVMQGLRRAACLHFEYGPRAKQEI